VRALRPCTFGLLLVSACNSSGGTGNTTASVSSAKPSPPPPAENWSPPPEPGATNADCGGMDCRQFDTPDEAFAAILEERPRILAIGETHAQKGFEKIASVTKRFTEGMLPQLKDHATALVLELWVNDGSCGKAKEKAVQQQQKEVVKDQAKTDQNEFVTLAVAAHDIGIVPYRVHPTCEELDKIQKAGDDGVFEMLSMLTSHMRDEATKLYKDNDKVSPNKVILTYGGAMHNDLVPRKGREQWSFAKDLDDLSGHKYIELDLVVPEYVNDSDTWKSMPWYDAFKKSASCEADAHGRTKTLVYTMAPRSYALIFPCAR
jgi:hypothetical protein